MKKPIRISDIDNIAKMRPEGYKADVMSHGEEKDGMLWIEWADYMELLKKYQPNSRLTQKMSDPRFKKPCCGGKARGMGDVVAKFAQPIARAIDKVAGTDIEHCGGCKKRQEYLNQLIPFSGSK